MVNVSDLWIEMPYLIVHGTVVSFGFHVSTGWSDMVYNRIMC